MSQEASNIKKAEQCPFCGANVDPESLLRGDGVRGPEVDAFFVASAQPKVQP